MWNVHLWCPLCAQELVVWKDLGLKFFSLEIVDLYHEQGNTVFDFRILGLVLRFLCQKAHLWP